MIRTYISLDGQSVHDVCLNTYGTLDKLLKLMTDNNFPSTDNYPPSRSVFSYDDTLVVNQAIRATSGTLVPFATRNTGVGIVAYNITEANGVTPISTFTPVGNQNTYTGIIDDLVHYDFNFIDAF